MNSEESSGGSSCNGQENGDGSNGSERPLKKARYAWQVKGKYHLKNENNDPAKIINTESTATEMAGPSGSESYTSEISNIRQDNSTTEINKNLYTSNSVVDETDKSVCKPSIGNHGSEDKSDHVFTLNETLPTDILNPQKSFSSQEHSESLILSSIETLIGRSQEKMSHWTIVPAYDYDNWVETEEQCIRRWQYRQREKVNLDNSINRILETMHLQAAGEIATLEEGVNSIENEGILMAISAHGLQNASSSFFSESLEEIRQAGLTSSPAIRISFGPYIGHVDESDDESEEDSQQDYPLNNLQWRLSNRLRNESNETIPSPTFHGTSNLTVNYENLHNTDEASDDVEIEDENHHDFLDAAVSFAIQSKGLTTFGTDYG